MKNDNVTPYSIVSKFSRIVKLWQELERQPKKFGIDEDLHRSEIHVIEVVGDNGGPGVTDIAETMGITKGAVSQTLKKLENKGLIAKEPDPGNRSRLAVKLTSKGKVAYYAHAHWHETMDDGFKAYCYNLSGDKMLFLDEFLTRVEAFLKKSR